MIQGFINIIQVIKFGGEKKSNQLHQRSYRREERNCPVYMNTDSSSKKCRVAYI